MHNIALNRFNINACAIMLCHTTTIHKFLSNSATHRPLGTETACSVSVKSDQDKQTIWTILIHWKIGKSLTNLWGRSNAHVIDYERNQNWVYRTTSTWQTQIWHKSYSEILVHDPSNITFNICHRNVENSNNKCTVTDNTRSRRISNTANNFKVARGKRNLESKCSEKIDFRPMLFGRHVSRRWNLQFGKKGWNDGGKLCCWKLYLSTTDFYTLWFFIRMRWGRTLWGNDNPSVCLYVEVCSIIPIHLDNRSISKRESWYSFVMPITFKFVSHDIDFNFFAREKRCIRYEVGEKEINQQLSFIRWHKSAAKETPQSVAWQGCTNAIVTANIQTTRKWNG